MLTVYTLEENEKWDEVVRSFSNFDVYWLSGYVKAFQIHGDGDPLLFFYQSDDVRGINVVMKRDIAKDRNFVGKIEENKYFDFSTPYGYGGWIMEGENSNCLFEEYEKWCITNGIISEFVRFHPILMNHKYVREHYQTAKCGDTVYIDTRSENIIWNDMTSKNRNMIRKAQKSGMEVFWSRQRGIIAPFINIYNETMERDHASSYYFFSKEFYESILHDLRFNSMWFYSTIDGEIAAISIFMFCNGMMHYHLSATNRIYQHIAPTNLLIYEAARWASNSGYKCLHLGGGVGSGKDSLYKFKKSFNRGDDREFYIGKKTYNTDVYKELIQLRKSTEEMFDGSSKYFPLYRNEISIINDSVNGEI